MSESKISDTSVKTPSPNLSDNVIDCAVHYCGNEHYPNCTYSTPGIDVGCSYGGSGSPRAGKPKECWASQVTGSQLGVVKVLHVSATESTVIRHNNAQRKDETFEIGRNCGLLESFVNYRLYFHQYMRDESNTIYRTYFCTFVKVQLRTYTFLFIRPYT